MVAKSYEGLEALTEPYTVNGKQYIKVQTKNGPKQVRWYTESEYNKFYSPVKVIQPAKSPKLVMGFYNDFITIFKGNTYECKDWLKEHEAKYNKTMGWYIPGDKLVPDVFPTGIEPITLHWEQISEGEQPKSESEIKSVVESLIYDHNESSTYVGEIGERIARHVVCNKVINLMGYYGPSTMYSFTDNDGNIFIWTTTSDKQHIEENTHYVIAGTVKDHRMYRNACQTVLSRCKVAEEA